MDSKPYRTYPGDILIHETTGEVRQVVTVTRAEDIRIDGRYYSRRGDDRCAMYGVAKLGTQAATPETFKRD